MIRDGVFKNAETYNTCDKNNECSVITAGHSEKSFSQLLLEKARQRRDDKLNINWQGHIRAALRAR